jgi:multidrug resistance protein MdtO
MATVTRNETPPLPPSLWLRQFLKEELAPYPGRTRVVAHMVIAATLVMIIGMTLRLAFIYLGSLYALLTSRESPRATLQSAASIFGAPVIGSAYVVVSVSFVINFPILHLISNIGSFFVTFYLLSVVNNHAASSIWAFMIVTGVPLWDRHLPAEVNLEDTLRITLIAVIGLAVTVAVELVFARRKAGDEIPLPIAERLDAVRSVLVCYAEGRPVDSPTRKTVLRLAMVGTSRLRRLLRRSDYPRHYRAVMNAVAAAAGRLVDISAALPQLGFEPSSAEQLQLRYLAEAVGRVRDDLWNRRVPAVVEFAEALEPSLSAPFLRELENVLALIPQAFVDSPIQDFMPRPPDGARVTFFALHPAPVHAMPRTTPLSLRTVFADSYGCFLHSPPRSPPWGRLRQRESAQGLCRNARRLFRRPRPSSQHPCPRRRPEGLLRLLPRRFY